MGNEFCCNNNIYNTQRELSMIKEINHVLLAKEKKQEDNILLRKLVEKEIEKKAAPLEDSILMDVPVVEEEITVKSLQDKYNQYLMDKWNKMIYLPQQMIEKSTKLGEGGFGEVWLAVMNKHTLIAMKNLKDKSDDDSKMKIIHEVEIMEKIRHPKLINFYGFWKDQGNLTSWIIDILPGGDLDKLIHKKPKKISMVERFIILKNIAIGIQGMHTKNIVHRDIKPGNVLFPEEISSEKIILHAKLADYGESIDLEGDRMKFIKGNKDTIDEYDCLDDYCGTLKYAPKEILIGDLRLLSTKSDIYCFGVLIWEIFTEKRPLENIAKDTIEDSAFEDELLKPYCREENGKLIKSKVPYIEGTPQEIDTLIEDCLLDEIEERPDIESIIERLIEIEERNGFTYSHGKILDKIESNIEFMQALYVPLQGSFSHNNKTIQLEKGDNYNTNKTNKTNINQENFDLIDQIKTSFLKSENQRVLLLLGSPGSGKSLFTKFLQNFLRKYPKLYVFRFDLQNYEEKDSEENQLENQTENSPQFPKSLLEQVMDKYHITEKEFNEMKSKTEQTQNRIIFIFDGLDESKWNKNIFLESEISKHFPLAKIIVTCRDEFFNTEELNRQKLPNLLWPFDSKGISEQNKTLIDKHFTKMYIKNFNDDQIQKYVSFYVDLNKNQDFMKNFLLKLNKNPFYNKESDKLKKCYSDIISLLAKFIPMINTPFLLEMMCKIIPQNEAFHDKEKFQKINKNTIYELFIYTLYEKEYEIFSKSQNFIESDINFKGIFIKDKIDEMIKFLENFAFINQLEILEKGNNYITKNTKMMEYFFLNDEKTKLFRNVAENVLLKEYEGGKWGFSHRSIREYFFAKRIIREFDVCKRAHADEEEYLKQIKDMTISGFKLNEHSSLLSFLCDYLKGNKKLEQKLWDCVYLTRNGKVVNKFKEIEIMQKQNINLANQEQELLDDEGIPIRNEAENPNSFNPEEIKDLKDLKENLDVLSSNSLTILNFGEVPLINRKLEYASFPYADLSNSMITNCDFSEANMENCVLNNANISDSKFIGTNLRNIIAENILPSGENFLELNNLNKNLESCHKEIISYALCPGNKTFVILSQSEKFNDNANKDKEFPSIKSEMVEDFNNKNKENSLCYALFIYSMKNMQFLNKISLDKVHNNAFESAEILALKKISYSPLGNYLIIEGPRNLLIYRINFTNNLKYEEVFSLQGKNYGNLEFSQDEKILAIAIEENNENNNEIEVYIEPYFKIFFYDTDYEKFKENNNNKNEEDILKLNDFSFREIFEISRSKIFKFSEDSKYLYACENTEEFQGLKVFEFFYKETKQINWDKVNSSKKLIDIGGSVAEEISFTKNGKFLIVKYSNLLNIYQVKDLMEKKGNEISEEDNRWGYILFNLDNEISYKISNDSRYLILLEKENNSEYDEEEAMEFDEKMEGMERIRNRFFSSVKIYNLEEKNIKEDKQIKLIDFRLTNEKLKIERLMTMKNERLPDNRDDNFQCSEFLFSPNGGYLLGFERKKLIIFDVKNNFKFSGALDLTFELCENKRNKSSNRLNSRGDYMEAEPQERLYCLKDVIKFSENEKYFFLAKENKMNLIAYEFSEFLNVDENEEKIRQLIMGEEKKRGHKFISNMTSNKLSLESCDFQGALLSENFKKKCEENPSNNFNDNEKIIEVKPQSRPMKEDDVLLLDDVPSEEEEILSDLEKSNDMKDQSFIPKHEPKEKMDDRFNLVEPMDINNNNDLNTLKSLSESRPKEFVENNLHPMRNKNFNEFNPENDSNPKMTLGTKKEMPRKMRNDSRPIRNIKKSPNEMPKETLKKNYDSTGKKSGGNDDEGEYDVFE